MASAYKNIVGVAGSGDVTVYTCPAATVAMVKNISLYNSHTGTVVVYLKIYDSSSDGTTTVLKLSMPTLLASSAPAALSTGSLVGPYVLEAGDKLIFNCDVASKLHVFANVLELS